MREVLDLVAQVADALEAAHEAGIVHRDLKPSNVIVTDEGRAVLVDFGIARSADAEPLTSTGTIVGTVDYISPEQCAGRTATPASDLWSLGMLAYECLTGHKPFRRESPVATALAVLHDDLPPLEGQPPGVAQLVAGLVVKDPGARARPGGSGRRPRARDPGRPDRRDRSRCAGSCRRRPAPARGRGGSGSGPGDEPCARGAPRWPRRVVAACLVVVGGVAARPAPDTVPDVTGADLGRGRHRADARPRSTTAGCSSTTRARRPETCSASHRRPAAAVDDDTVVVVRVASGQTTLDADDVTGLGYARAAREVVALGLVPSRGSVVSVRR